MNKKQREKIKEEKKSKRLVLHPMLPRQYNAEQRAKIREAERKLFKGE